jgi:integrase
MLTAANMLPKCRHMKNQWPKIKEVKNHGKTAYMVDCRINGRGERRFFDTRGSAKTYANEQRVTRLNEGAVAFDDSRLAKHGWTIAQAIKFALDHLERVAASVTLTTAIEKLIASKAGAGRSAQYCNELRWRLNKFAAEAGDKTLAQITAPEIEAFLSALNLAPGTWNSYRRDLVTLWSFAIKAGFATTNEAQKCERAQETPAAPGILTPTQAADLLATPQDNDLLAAHAIGLFAGLRTSEIGKLDWRDVDLAGGFIHVSAANSKTRARRLVPILDNLRDWLTPIAKTSGKITAVNFNRRASAVRKAAGITEWPDNALRHSFVSYRLADTANAAQTALESGHAQAVLFAHYREIVKPKDAARFFNIRPSASAEGKIVAMA